MTPKKALGSALGLGGLLIALVAAVQAQAGPAQQSTVHTAPKTQIAVKQMSRSPIEGERIFAQNCSRCHNAPEGFSPRISGTIVRHMRVRAQLSQHDEEELLRFLNP
jgi:mono/diheme cytochrome c family protein